MSQLKLNEIKDWVEKQWKLYDDYFQELWKVKVVLVYYNCVKDIIEWQVQMINEYKGVWVLFKEDKNFIVEELDYIYNIYLGMMYESLKSIDQLFLVVNVFVI